MYDVLCLQSCSCVVAAEAFSNTKVWVVSASTTDSGCESPLPSRTTYAAHTAISTSCRCVGVVRPTKSLETLVTSRSRMLRSGRTLLLTKWHHQFSPELFMRELPPGITVLQVKYVRVNHYYLHHPKKHLAPPADWLAHKRVVGHALVQAIHPQHILVVFVNNHWLIFWGCTRKPIETRTFTIISCVCSETLYILVCNMFVSGLSCSYASAYRSWTTLTHVLQAYADLWLH